MTFEELNLHFYEDLQGGITSVLQVGETIQVHFECDDWDNYDKRRKFKLEFLNVVEAVMVPCEIGALELYTDHPLLWQHNEQHMLMYYASSPNPYELIGKLYEVHNHLHKGWRSLSDYFYASVEWLKEGRGLLAEGPRRVIEEYGKTVGDSLRYSIVEGHVPKGGYRVFVFEKCFIVCKEVSVFEELVDE
jgi:hypothetical protein